MCSPNQHRSALLEQARRVNMPQKLWEIMDLRGPALFISSREAAATGLVHRLRFLKNHKPKLKMLL